MANESKEQLRIRSTVEKQSGPRSPEALREIKKKAADVVKTESAEAAETQEGVEFSEGKVSESASEDKSRASQAGGKRSYTADEIEAIRAKLLAALPSQEVMLKQIKRTLYSEEKTLVKKMKRARKKAHKHAFELTIIVAQLRKIREYFSILAHATYEMVKNLWLKIVHGV